MKVRIHMLAFSACTLLTLSAAATAALSDTAAPLGAKKGGARSSSSCVEGTITSIDPGSGTIAVAPVDGGEASIIQIAPGTTLRGRRTITDVSIALGDRMEVSGLPLALQVSSIVNNHLPMPSATSGSSAEDDAPGSLRVAGVVTALVPPTLTIDSTFTLTLALTAATTFAEVRSLAPAQLAVGQTIRAQVAESLDGTLTATLLDVTLPLAVA